MRIAINDTLEFVATIIGVLLLVLCGLLREREEQRLERAIDALWIRFDDLRRQGVSKGAALLSTVATATLHVMELLFGRRLFSLRAAWTSGAVSFASLLLAFETLRSRIGGNYPFTSKAALLLAFAVLAHAFLPLAHRWAGKILWALLLVDGLWLVWDNRGYPPMLLVYSFLAGVVLLGIACSLLALAGLRSLLVWMAQETRFWRILAALLLTVGLVCTLVIVPVIAGLLLVRMSPSHLQHYMELQKQHQASSAPLLVLCFALMTSLSNVATALFIGIYSVVLLLALLPPMVFEAVDRALYSVARHRIVNNRKVLFGLGLSLIGMGARPEIAELLRKVRGE